MLQNKQRPTPIRLPSAYHQHSHPISPQSPRGCPAGIHRAPTPPPPFRLLDLPSEVVNQVVEYVLVSHDNIVIHEPRFNRHPTPPPRARSHPRLDRKVLPTPPSSRGASPASQHENERVVSPHRGNKNGTRGRKDSSDVGVGHTRLALLLASRQLYHDYWTMYYTANTFEFLSLDTFKKFVSVLDPKCRNQIRNVSLHMPRKHHHGVAWGLIEKMKRLDEVEIWLHAATTMSAADVGEWEACDEGVKLCENLRVMTIRREGEHHIDWKDQGDTENSEESSANSDESDVDVEHAAHDGVNGQHGQQTDEDEQEEDSFEAVLKKDREVEGRINNWLRDRYDLKVEASSSSCPRTKSKGDHLADD